MLLPGVPIMIFDKTNARLINTKEVYLHDDSFVEFRFDRISYKAILCLYSYKKHCYEITFHGVIGIEMTSCDFWGPSPHVLDFEFIETNNRILIPRLIAEEKKFPFPGSTPISNENYIETVLTFTSGDHFRIACESIEIGDNYRKMPKEPDENDVRHALLKAMNNTEDGSPA